MPCLSWVLEAFEICYCMFACFLWSDPSQGINPSRKWLICLISWLGWFSLLPDSGPSFPISSLSIFIAFLLEGFEICSCVFVYFLWSGHFHGINPSSPPTTWRKRLFGSPLFSNLFLILILLGLYNVQRFVRPWLCLFIGLCAVRGIIARNLVLNLTYNAFFYEFAMS